MELTKEKREHFLYQIFCQKEILFSICVLSPCVVYWLHLQNIHSFAYQKTLIHTSFCLKSLKGFSVFLRVVLVGTKNMHQKIFRRIWWFSNFSWLKGSLNISPMYLCVFQMNFHVSYFFQGFFPILTTSWKKGILLFGKVISCFFLLINTYCTQHHIFFQDHNASVERIHEYSSWQKLLFQKIKVSWLIFDKYRSRQSRIFKINIFNFFKTPGRKWNWNFLRDNNSY